MTEEKDIRKTPNLLDIEVINKTPGLLQMKPGINIARGESRTLSEMNITLEDFDELYDNRFKRMEERGKLALKAITTKLSKAKKEKLEGEQAEKEANKTKTLAQQREEALAAADAKADGKEEGGGEKGEVDEDDGEAGEDGEAGDDSDEVEDDIVEPIEGEDPEAAAVRAEIAKSKKKKGNKKGKR